MINIILIAIILLIAGSAALYLYRTKKCGKHCIGCPYAKQCSEKSCGCNSNKD